MQSFMHNFTLFLEKKSEILYAFTLFKKWKVNLVFLSLSSRMKSELKIHWDRDQEWKVKWKCLEIEKWNLSRNSGESRNQENFRPDFGFQMEKLLHFNTVNYQNKMRLKSEMKMPQDRNREWKVKLKFLKIERWNFQKMYNV